MLQESLKLEIPGKNFDVVTKARYLGVQVDNSFDWKDQTKRITSKVYRAIGFLKYAKNIISIASVQALYAGSVEPHFRYCCSVWGCCGAATINQLHKLQNRAAIILKESNFNAPSGPLIESLSWKTVRELVHEESIVMVYKSVDELAPQYLHNPFIRNSSCSMVVLWRVAGNDKRNDKEPLLFQIKNFDFLEMSFYTVSA